MIGVYSGFSLAENRDLLENRRTADAISVTNQSQPFQNSQQPMAFFVLYRSCSRQVACESLFAPSLQHFSCVSRFSTRRICSRESKRKQELSPFSTRRICSRDAKRKQEFSNVIGWRKSSLLRQPITLPDSCFRFASREQIRLVENGL